MKPCLLVTTISLLVFSNPGFTCSTCRCGDPSLTVMGNEKPYQGRSRVSLEYTWLEEQTGQNNFNRKTVEESRWTLGASYNWTPRLAVGVRLPWVDKSMHSDSLASAESQALGDIELSAKWFLQPESNAHRQLYGLSFGVRLPTAEQQTTPSGALLDIDAQPGIGATLPNIGAWYASFQYPRTYYASSSLHFSGDGDQGFHAGESLTLTLQAQQALNYRHAVALGLDSRISKPNQYEGQDDPDSGGFLSFASFSYIYSPLSDLLLSTQIQLPVIEQLDGNHEEKRVLTLGVTYDF